MQHLPFKVVPLKEKDPMISPRVLALKRRNYPVLLGTLEFEPRYEPELKSALLP